ncbi:MAG: aldo/keto reductase [Fusobacteria bacterium]|nr:aldo/keto reductase [Fusobacteriota bacterium]
MIYNFLGNSDMNVSKLGYGSWALGKTGWKNVNQDEAIKTFEKSIELGINFIDTAPIYGFGKSEMIIGDITKSIRKNLYIASKTGLEWSDTGRVIHNLSRDFILSDIEKSLKRLKTDYIDLYQIHWPYEGFNLKEVLNTLNELKKNKIIKYIGVSNFKINLLKNAYDIIPICSIQNQFNILQNNDINDIIPFCTNKNIGFIAYSPLAQGLLSGCFDKNYTLSKNDIRRFNPLFHNKNIYNEINKIEKPILQTSINYLLNNNVSVILISMTKEKHLIENINILNKKKV